MRTIEVLLAKVMHLLLFAEAIQLFPDGTIFIHIALLLGMIWLLNRTLYKPINQVLAAREKSKGSHGSEAAGIMASVDEKESRYARELLEARTRGHEMIEKEQKKAAEAREKKLAEVKAETAQKFDSARTALNEQASAVRTDIGANAEKMADQIAATILKS